MRLALFSILIVATLGCTKAADTTASETAKASTEAPAEVAAPAAAHTEANVTGVSCDKVVNQMARLMGRAIKASGDEENYAMWVKNTEENMGTLIASCERDLGPENRECVMHATNILELEGCTNCEDCNARMN